MAAWRYEISLLVLKKIFHSFAALTREIFSTLEEKFRIAARPCNSLYIQYIYFKISMQSLWTDCVGSVSLTVVFLYLVKSS